MALADLLHPLAALCRARLHPSDRARTNQARRSDEIRRSDEALQAGQPLQADETGHSVLSFQSDEPRQAALAMPEIDIEGMPAMPDSLTAAASGHIPDSPADRSSIASHASTGASAAGQSDGLASGQTAGQAAGTAAGAAAEPTGRTLAQAAPSGTPAPRLAVPAAIAARVRLEGSVLHCSAELRGSPELDLMLAKAERQGMVLSCAWHVPAAFEQRFGLHAVLQDGIEVTGCAGRDAQTWVEEATRALVARAVEKKATDIHITCMGPYASIRFRRMGLMVDEGAMDGETGARLVRGIFQGQLSQAEAGFSLYERYDGRITDRRILPDGVYAVRLHSEPLQSPVSAEPGVGLAMRVLFDAAPVRGGVAERLSALGFTKEQCDLVGAFSEIGGLTIISGPTGHGKTTLLRNYMEAHAEQHPELRHASLEDPAEYPMIGVEQRSVCTRQVSEAERRAALDTALAGLMRSDPDVIMLGEVRWLEAAKFAVGAALTGHSVWTTVHAGSALAIVPRLHEMGLPLASLCGEGVLTGLTYQRLLPVLCPHCSLPLVNHRDRLSDRLRARLDALFPGDAQEHLRLRGPGCPHCDHMGLVGQQVAAEVISVRDPRLMDLLREGRLREAFAFWVRETGGMTHLAHARQRIAAGEVDPVLAEERLGTTLNADLEALDGAQPTVHAVPAPAKPARRRSRAAKKRAAGPTDSGADSAADGAVDSAADGTAGAAPGSSPEGGPEDLTDGPTEGATDGAADTRGEGPAPGAMEGAPDGAMAGPAAGQSHAGEPDAGEADAGPLAEKSDAARTWA